MRRSVGMPPVLYERVEVVTRGELDRADRDAHISHVVAESRSECRDYRLNMFRSDAALAPEPQRCVLRARSDVDARAQQAQALFNDLPA